MFITDTVFLPTDIQEFYEATLLDQHMSTHEKTQATLLVAERYASPTHAEPEGHRANGNGSYPDNVSKG